MFNGDRLTQPKIKSFVGTVVVAATLWAGAQVSSYFGYFIALFSMLMMIVAMQMESIWPTERKPENSIVFSLFWGCMTGVLFPFLLSAFLEGGFKALYALFI